MASGEAGASPETLAAVTKSRWVTAATSARTVRASISSLRALETERRDAELHIGVDADRVGGEHPGGEH